MFPALRTLFGWKGDIDIFKIESSTLSQPQAKFGPRSNLSHLTSCQLRDEMGGWVGW